MKRKKTIFILGVVLILGFVVFGVISTKTFNPFSSKAQTNQGNVFETINQRARENNLNQNLAQSEEIAGLIMDNLSVLYVPKSMQEPIMTQIATAHLNGSNFIDENNIAASVNDLADSASAPEYAYTNVEQVKVVRTFLHRLMPDLVSSSGAMTDLEAFAVFTATVSQKVDNDAFMVPASKFSARLQLPVNQALPGSPAADSTTLTVSSESENAAEMLDVVNNYANSTNMMSASQILGTIGIQ